MHAGGDPNIESLLQRLEPTQGHADTRISLAGRDRFEQLFRRTAEIDEIDIKIVLGKNASLFCDRAPLRYRSRTHSMRV